MAKIIKYLTENGRVKEYLLSGNTPDYESPVPPYSFLINPDVSGVLSVPMKYWKVSGGVVSEMTTEEKAVIDAEEDLARTPVVYPAYSVSTLNMVQCDNADWPINRAVTVLQDPAKASIKVIQLDNGVASGIGYSLVFPSGGVSCIWTEAFGRSSITPDTADRTLLFQIRFRVIPYDEAINSWQTKNFNAVTVPQTVYYNKFSWLTNIGAGTFDNKLVQIVFARRATDTLPNPFYLERVHFKFS